MCLRQAGERGTGKALQKLKKSLFTVLAQRMELLKLNRETEMFDHGYVWNKYNCAMVTLFLH